MKARPNGLKTLQKNIRNPGRQPDRHGPAGFRCIEPGYLYIRQQDQCPNLRLLSLLIPSR